MMNIVTGDETEVGACIMGLTGGFFPANLRNHARMPHCLQWGGMASLLGGLGDRFPQPNRYLPSKSPAACCGDLYCFQLLCTASHNVPSFPATLYGQKTHAASHV